MVHCLCEPHKAWKGIRNTGHERDVNCAEKLPVVPPTTASQLDQEVVEARRGREVRPEDTGGFRGMLIMIAGCFPGRTRNHRHGVTKGLQDMSVCACARQC